MTTEKLEEMLQAGEGFTVEYKECVNGLNNSVFETVCSFSNRYGGHIILGVKETEDHKGRVIGVNPKCIVDMKKNFVNVLNNPQKMSPSLYLNLEEFDYGDKKILWVYVPVSSQIELCGGRIYDRNNDADQDITTSSDLVSNISNRKSKTYTERIIFPYCTKEHLKMEMIPRVKTLALNRNENHPWKDMDDMELMKSAGLYEKDIMTGKKGFNLAAILLFGKPEVIRSCVPGYKTDAIYRAENMDRYDDRLIVEENLIESYDLLMNFIAKHTNDKFFLIDNVSVSVRNAIAREIVSNILVHREFSTAFPAKLVVEPDKIYTENWNRAQRVGRIEPQNFTPYPKNPVLANFFVNIGYADSLGSGVRNLYKYTKIYSGGEPDFEEGDVFKLTVPLKERNESERVDDNGTKTCTKVGTNGTKVGTKSGTNDTKTGTDVHEEDIEAKIVELIRENKKITQKEMQEQTGTSLRSIKRYISKLQSDGVIKRVGSSRSGYWEINE